MKLNNILFLEAYVYICNQCMKYNLFVIKSAFTLGEIIQYKYIESTYITSFQNEIII